MHQGSSEDNDCHKNHKDFENFPQVKEIKGCLLSGEFQSFYSINTVFFQNMARALIIFKWLSDQALN